MSPIASTSGPLVVCRLMAVAWLAILRLGRVRNMSTVHSRSGFMTGTKSRAWHSTGCHLRILGASNLSVASPEWSTASAPGVIVLGTGAVALLFLVVTSKESLYNGGDEEEEDVEDSHGEAGGVQTAHIAPVASAGSIFTRKTDAEGSVDESLA